jgi:hypothetical protein
MATTASATIDGERLARLEELLARQEILDCLIRFSRGIDRFDRELFLSAFHPDAIIAAGDFVGGPEQLYAWATDLHERGQSSTLHNLLNHSCEVHGGVAHTETYYLFTGRNRDETNWMAGGRYVDRLENRDRAWRIVVRCNAVEWSGTIPSGELPFEGVPDLDRNGPCSRNRDDLSYRRPLTNRRRLRVPGE